MIIAYIDGGARGNPGPAGYGVRVEDAGGRAIEEFSAAIGVATNNVAEYRGLIAALEYAAAQGHRDVTIRSDSQLLVKQMRGEYRVKHPGLQPLHAHARELAAHVGRVRFEHVPRARNADADRLANEAMDEAASAGPPAGTRPADIFTPLERRVRQFVYTRFVETAAAPDAAAIARATGASGREVAAALRRLADARALVLAPATLNVWMAHPFSAVPTAFPVVTPRLKYWANCAWDAAGVLSLVGDGVTATRCPDCHAEISMRVRAGRIDGDGVIHYAVPPRRFWENVAFT